MPTRPSHPEGQAAPAKPTPSLSTRALKLRWWNPRMALTLLREKYRQKFGLDPDRRFRRIISPAGSGAVHPRRQPEFSLKEIFRPSLLKLDCRPRAAVLAHLTGTVSAPAEINATGT